MKRAATIALLVGVISLMFELLQVRLLSFLIGKSMDVLAIPIALLGLAIGSMFRHFVYKGEPQVLLRWACLAVLPVCAASLLAMFGVASFVFPQVHVTLATPSTEAGKVLLYGAIFLPPYMLFGSLLATLFAMTPDRIGTLYFFDLLGAAIGCALAPVMLTLSGLQASLAVLFVFAFALAMVSDAPAQARGAIGGVLALCLVLLGTGIGFEEHIDATVLARVFKDLRSGAREADVRWNAIARTSLLTRAKPSERYVIVQDNGLSNVQVTPWREKPRPDAIDKIGPRTMPWRMGLEPKNILITFAGMGRDMVFMDELAKGQATITGVELNPTVVAWAHHPELAYTRLPEFLARDNIQLLAREGRDFLNTDDQQYDLIFVANNGAVHAGRTGHTRKFLDTQEAMEAYLARLGDGGILMFMNQPVQEKVRSLRAIWEAQGRTDFRDCIYVYGNGSPTLDTMIFKPSGLKPNEIAAIDETVKGWKIKKILPPKGPVVKRMQPLIEKPLSELPATTDDKPFTHKVEWWNFTLIPDPSRVWRATYVSSWAKVFTVLVFVLVSALVALVAVFLGTPEQRVPARWAGYLFLSGIGYMCIQIPLIAKTELLVGNPLYAVSVNLAVFLVFNALGSRLFEERKPPNPSVLAIGVVVAAAWALLTMDVAIAPLLSVPLLVKALAVAVFVGPVAMVMGMFYPWCVTALSNHDKGAAVPMTYGLTTLASVVGSAFAMAAIINLGFTAVILMGVVAYVGSTALSQRL